MTLDREAPRMLVRYRANARMNHWFVAILFFCAGLTGLAIFHPFFFPVSNLFGGGVWTRILHPFFGVVMALGFLGLFIAMWRENVLDETDSAWLKAAPKLLRGHEQDMPPVGKNNAGQKLVFWIAMLCLMVLFVTGFTFWQPWFADLFSVPLRRVAVVLHAAAATVLILTIITHIYAAIWVKGSVDAMTRGTVTEGWARFHHPLWRAGGPCRPAVARRHRVEARPGLDPAVARPARAHRCAACRRPGANRGSHPRRRG